MKRLRLITRLKEILKYTDGTGMGAIIASDKLKALIKQLNEKKHEFH